METQKIENGIIYDIKRFATELKSFDFGYGNRDLIEGSKVDIFSEENESYKKIVNQIKEDINNGRKLSIGLSGGGLMGVIQYEILKDLEKEGIEGDEYVGNSVGSIIASLFASDNYDDKSVNSIIDGLTQIELSDIPYLVLAKMSPFLTDATIDGEFYNLKDFLIRNSQQFFNLLKEHAEFIYDKGLINESYISVLIKTLLLDKGIINSINDQVNINYLSFNDIENKTGKKLKIIAGAMNFSDILPGGEDGFYTYRFEGKQKVLNGLVHSTSVGGPGNIVTDKGDEIKVIDGYLLGAQFPTKNKDYGYGKNSRKLLIQLDPDSPGYFLNQIVLPENYGVNNYVIAPNIQYKHMFDLDTPFNAEKIPYFKAVAKDIIGK